MTHLVAVLLPCRRISRGRIVVHMSLFTVASPTRHRKEIGSVKVSHFIQLTDVGELTLPTTLDVEIPSVRGIPGGLDWRSWPWLGRRLVLRKGIK